VVVAAAAAHLTLSVLVAAAQVACANGLVFQLPVAALCPSLWAQVVLVVSELPMHMATPDQMAPVLPLTQSVSLVAVAAADAVPQE
jgi:ABC-type arginine transport system ATPase subunit